MKPLALIALVLSLGGSAAAQTPAPAAAPAVNATGTWDATFNTQNGQVPAQIKLNKAADGKITGTISSQMGEANIEAEVKDKAVAVWFSMQGQNGPIAIELNGTVDGDTLKGNFTAGGSPAGDFVATRAKTEAAAPAKAPAATTAPAAASTSSSSSAASLTGTWNLSVELPNMTATPTMALKQDGEKLTGEYVSAQYGKFPITGTVKGADVTFWFGMNVEGTALNVTYTGKVAKDGTVAGSVTYGDMMSGTFTAKKQ